MAIRKSVYEWIRHIKREGDHILIDKRGFSDSLLKKLKNAVAYFFLLDKTDLRKRERAEERIIRILQELEQRDSELFDLLGRYISGLMEYRGAENIGVVPVPT